MSGQTVTRLQSDIDDYNVLKDNAFEAAKQGSDIADIKTKAEFARALSEEIGSIEKQIVQTQSVLNNSTYTGQRPFLTFIFDSYDTQINGFTTQWGTPYTEEYMQNLLLVMIGADLAFNGTETEVGRNYRDFSKYPEFLNVPFKRQTLIYDRRSQSDNTSNNYTYAPISVAMTALHNETDADISIDLHLYGTSGGTYNPLSINVLRPDVVIKENVSDVNFESLSSFTSNSYTSRESTLSIAAGETVIVMFTAGCKYIADGYSYDYVSMLELYDLDEMFAEGIVADTQVLANIDPNKNYRLNDITQIWTYSGE